MMDTNGYNITFSYGDETETLKLIATSERKAMEFFERYDLT